MMVCLFHPEDAVEFGAHDGEVVERDGVSFKVGVSGVVPKGTTYVVDESFMKLALAAALAEIRGEPLTIQRCYFCGTNPSGTFGVCQDCLDAMEPGKGVAKITMVGS